MGHKLGFKTKVLEMFLDLWIVSLQSLPKAHKN
jgi:hypothetical protein